MKLHLFLINITFCYLLTTFRKTQLYGITSRWTVQGAIYHALNCASGPALHVNTKVSV